MNLSVALAFLFALNTVFVIWHLKKKQPAKRLDSEPGVIPSELALLQTALQMEKAERHRVANALHYKSSSTIAAVKMYLNAVRPTGADMTPPENFDNVHALLDSAYVEINKSLYSLMPEIALENGLDEGLRKYCSHLTTHKILTIEYDSWGTSLRYHEAFELAVFRFVQMLVNSILQHNRAGTAVVQMGMRNGYLTIAVEEGNSSNMPAQSVAEDGMFLQLDSSIRSLNGQLELRTDNGLSAFIQLETATFVKEEPLLAAS